MFIAIISTLYTLVLLAEYVLHQRWARSLSPARKWLYYGATICSLLPYFVIFLSGLVWDQFSPLASALTSVGIVLFLLNAVVKAALLGWVLSAGKWLRTLFVAFGIFVSGLILYGYLWERFSLRTTHVEVAFDNLPEEADGLRIAQVGDLHIGLGLGRHHILRKMADEIELQRPDVVIDCGDMVNSRYLELDTVAMDILSRVKAPLGVYTTFGNHDRGDYIRDTLTLPRAESRALLAERQRSMGWLNITDSTVLLPTGGDPIYLTALDYPASLGKGSHGRSPEEGYVPHFEDIPDGAFNIVIAHTPIMWDNILSATEAELTLSGHVHSMQMRIPIGERGWSPAALVYPHWSGLYRKGECALHITDGIGGSLPLRVGVKPQVVIITLRKN